MTEPLRQLARAEVMLDLGRHQEAATVLARVVAAEPELGRAWCLLALAYMRGDDYAQMALAAGRAVAVAPSSDWAHRLASTALTGLGRHDDAIRAAKEARRLGPHSWQTHSRLARAARCGGQLDLAAEAAEEARRLAPDEDDTHFCLGLVQFARGDFRAAQRSYERVLAIDPSHSGAMNELGRIRLRLGEPTGAVRQFVRAAAAAPREGLYRRNAQYVMLRLITRTMYVTGLLCTAASLVVAYADVRGAGLIIVLSTIAALLAAWGWFVVAWATIADARHLLVATLRQPRVATAMSLALAGMAGAVAAALAPVPMLIRPSLVVLAVFGAQRAACVILRTPWPRLALWPFPRRTSARS